MIVLVGEGLGRLHGLPRLHRELVEFRSHDFPHGGPSHGPPKPHFRSLQGSARRPSAPHLALPRSSRPGGAVALPEILVLLSEIGPRVVAPQALELRVELVLFGGQARRDHDLGPHELIAGAPALHARHAVARQAERPSASGAGRDLHRDAAAQGRHFHRRAERRLRRGDRQLDLQIVALALEERVGRDVDDQIQIAAGVGAAAALARHPHALAGPHPGGNLHLELSLGALPAAAVARRAWLAVDVARALAGGAGLLALEAEALARAVERFVERDLDAGLDVVATAPSAARAPPEQVFQSLEVDALPSAAASSRTGAEIAKDRPEEVREASEILRVAVLDVEATGKSRARLTRRPL